MSYSVVGPRDIDDSEASFCKLGGEGFFGLDLTPSCRDVLVDTQRTRNNFYSISHSICWYFFQQCCVPHHMHPPKRQRYRALLKGMRIVRENQEKHN